MPTTGTGVLLNKATYQYQGRVNEIIQMFSNLGRPLKAQLDSEGTCIVPIANTQTI